MKKLYHYVRAHRDLLALAGRDSFSGLHPEEVANALDRFAAVRVSKLPISLTPSNSDRLPEDYLSKVQNDALARVWLLAQQERKERKLDQYKWSRVMASCNTLMAG